MKIRNKTGGNLKKYMCWPIYLTLILIAADVLLYTQSTKAGLILTAGILIYLLVSIVLYHAYRPGIINELFSFANSYDSVKQRLLENLAIPYGLMDSHGKMIWINRAFADLLGEEQFFDKSVTNIFPEFTLDFLPKSVSEGRKDELVSFGTRIYRIVLERFSVEDILANSKILQGVNLDGKKEIISIYLYDETELREYIQKNEDDKLVMALAYLDNYEEALESVEDVRRSLLIALIDRKITKYFANFDGVVRKIEKDKYFIILRNSSLALLKEQRFHILNEVKTVNIGNEMALTLSIGIGYNAESYLQNYDYCRIAIEMALGRGGDQVVIKNGNNITYFGGKAQSVEKNTRVKARVKAQALKEFMSTKDRVVVMGHKITDVDSLGAAIGIYRAGKNLGKPVHIVIDDPSASIKPLMAGFINNPDYEPTMFIGHSDAIDITDNNTVVVVVDTNRPNYTECPELLKLTRTIVVFDHHRRGSEVIENAVLSYVEPYASSACEMVAEILQYFSDDLRLHSIEADCLYAGILIDTNNFATHSGVRTFEAAAFLRRHGADMNRVRKLLREDMNACQAKADAVRSARMYKGVFAVAQCNSDGLESPTIVGAQAANELLNIAGVSASFVLTEYKNEIFISARAIDEVNVQVLMEKMGGGGHLNIAGAQLKTGMDQARKMLENILDEYLKEQSMEEKPGKK